MYRVPLILKGLKEAAQETAGAELFFSDPQNGGILRQSRHAIEQVGARSIATTRQNEKGEPTPAAIVR